MVQPCKTSSCSLSCQAPETNELNSGKRCPHAGAFTPRLCLKASSHLPPVQELLALVRTKQRELEENHEKGKTVTRSDEMRELRDAMQRQMDEVQTIVKQIKDRLEALDKANAAAIKKKVSSSAWLIKPCLMPRACAGRDRP